MTYRELYKSGIKELANIPDGDYDCLVLCDEILGVTRHQIIVNGDRSPSKDKSALFINAINKRKSGYPLQYILGHWYFGELKLKVTEGVLIPREDSLILVDVVTDYIGNKPLVGIDLCAGTGAIALGIHQNCPNAHISALELYPQPLNCLNENINTYGDGVVKSANGDVISSSTADRFIELDFIASNPPYIEAKEIPSLQKEVQFEPKTALDGGNDGLDFYREITRLWKNSLKPSGLLAFEIGETQGQAVSNILKQNDFTRIQIKKDLSAHDRVVFGFKQ